MNKYFEKGGFIIMSKKKLFVPGRLCLFGEHSDWAGRYTAQNSDILPGMAIVTGINLGIYASAELSDNLQISTFDSEGNRVKFKIEMHREQLKKEALKDNYFCYCCGVAAYMRENYNVGGMKLDVTEVTLPMKKGLSSSAAICVLVAKAFNELYDLHLSNRGIMKIAYAGERLTKSRCGRMDQACAYGEHPIIMEFSDEEINVTRLKVGKTLHWVFAYLHASKDTKKILSYLNRSYPFAQSMIDHDVQYALGQGNHQLIHEAVRAIEEGNAEELGAIMDRAQKLFDEKIAPACPEQLNAPVLHKTMNDVNIRHWIYGTKGVGSQGDGTIQFLTKDKICQEKLVNYLKDEKGMDAYAFDINAGGKIRKAIIPIAGFGTRMYPETHFIKKAFLPIINKDGIVEPVLLCILQELDEAEIEEIIIIVGEGEENIYKDFFNYDKDDVFYNKLSGGLKKYYEQIHDIGQKLIFVEQKEKKGFGHAVYQARKYLNQEPALLMLGDFIYESDLDISCTRQTINAYNKSGGKAVVAIKEVPLQQVSTYGIISGKFCEDRNYLMKVSKMVEKPSTEYAESHLKTKRPKEGETYYATFGQYVLTDEIFMYLEKQIENFETEGGGGEVDITAALADLAKKDELVAVDVAGKSYDVGIPSLYYETFTHYGK